MKFRNDELGSTLNKLNSLRALMLEGDVSLAIVEVKDQIRKALSIAEQKIKEQLEHFCTLDETGKPVVVEETADSGPYLRYKFPDDETENKCKIVLAQIDELEVEIDIPENSITREEIKRTRCSSDQAEALLLLIVPKA